MPVNYKKDPMAEYVNRAIDVNGRMRKGEGIEAAQAIDMILSRMVSFQNSDLLRSANDQSEGNIPLIDLTLSDAEDMESPVRNRSKPTETAKIESARDNKRTENLTLSKSEPVSLKLPQVPSTESVLYFLPMDYSKRNPWRRIIGFHSSGLELQSSTYPARSSVKKLRFAQAKKPLNYMYSYFSVEILDCDDKSSIRIGICRKDYPSKIPPGKAAGSVGYCSDTGSIFLRDTVQLDGHEFSKGDVIGCGIIYPSHYKRYVDLSTDENSDGMTDVVLTSILNKKSMDFVRSVLNINVQKNPDIECERVSGNSELKPTLEDSGCDYYNENFVESRTQVEVYFTYNMQVIGKVLTHIPIGGFYPTIHIYSTSAIKMNVDLNPPSS